MSKFKQTLIGHVHCPWVNVKLFVISTFDKIVETRGVDGHLQ